MISFAKRNLKLYFRDKSGVFFSMLGVLIVFLLYTLFLGKGLADGMKNIDNSKLVSDVWILAGILTIASVTTSTGALSVMVDDKRNHIYKDFYVMPIKRNLITRGYLFNAIIISIIMSLITLGVAQIYILLARNYFLGIDTLIMSIGLIVLSSIASSTIVFFIISFVHTNNGYVGISTVIGTLMGFLTGVYLPIGTLSEGMQNVIKFFPISHSTSLFRQVLMKDVLSTNFKDIPSEYLVKFKEEMGVIYYFGDNKVTSFQNILILLVSILIFYLLSKIRLSKKID